MSKVEFLRWVQRQDRRHELVGGRALMHPGSTYRRAGLTSRFVTAIARQLNANLWAVTAADFAVEAGDTVRYPDVLIASADLDGQSLSTDAPVLAIEILSPSSQATDMTAKVEEYTSLSALKVHIVASQDKAMVWVWERDAATHVSPATPREIAGPDAAIEIVALGLLLPMSELYRGIKAEL